MKTITILSLILLGIFLFYWFQVRPGEIRNYCDRVAWEEMLSDRPIKEKTYDWKYTQCLHSQGLK